MLRSMHQHSELHALPPRLTVRQAADLLRVRPAHLLLAALTGALPVRRRGARLLIPTAELLAEFGLAFQPQEAPHDHDC